MQGELKLTPTSYIVLGMLSWFGEATPYQLKQAVAQSVGNFWSLQHAALYAEPKRLAAVGYVTETAEQGGRRRRRYALTDKGREALNAWRGEPTDELGELREPALLKLFFGADPQTLAPIQIEAHRRKLGEYEALRDSLPDEIPEGPRLALAMGIRAEQQQIAYWERVLRGDTSEALAGAVDGRSEAAAAQHGPNGSDAGRTGAG
jgi:PadR family transcriptional regulator, regulatory protein AphA